MMASQPRANEAARLEVLHDFEVLDTDPEQTFDDITRLAAYICHTPIAIITLIDAHRQWFKSRVGLSLSETARDVSFCAHAIKQPGPMVVRDALDDARFRDNPLVRADPHIRFYAGSPLVTIEGFSLGTLCVIDRYPREITPEQMAALRVLSQQVMTQLELRRTIKSLTRSLNDARRKAQELEGRLQNEGGQFAG
jgi:GAF domain-containing protein